MRIKRIFGKLFKKAKSNEELEDELTEQILKENEEALHQAYEEDLQASVITYVQSDDEYDTIHPVVLVDIYTGKMMPDVGSIIWITETNIMRPFIVVRYDYMQNDNMYESMKVYIVVRPAVNANIL